MGVPHASGHTLLLRVALAIAALGGSGCYATWDISPRELSKLAGYSAPRTVELVSTSGEPFTYGKEHSLAFDGIADGYPPRPFSHEVQLDAVNVRIDIDGGNLSGTDRERGKPFEIDLREVNRVRARQFSAGGTAGLVVGVTLGAATIAALVAGVVALHGASWGLDASPRVCDCGIGRSDRPPRPR